MPVPLGFFSARAEVFGVQVLVLQSLHEREYVAVMLGSIRNKRTF